MKWFSLVSALYIVVSGDLGTIYGFSHANCTLEVIFSSTGPSNVYEPIPLHPYLSLHMVYRNIIIYSSIKHNVVLRISSLYRHINYQALYARKSHLLINMILFL